MHGLPYGRSCRSTLLGTRHLQLRTTVGGWEILCCIRKLPSDSAASHASRNDRREDAAELAWIVTRIETVERHGPQNTAFCFGDNNHVVRTDRTGFEREWFAAATIRQGAVFVRQDRAGGGKRERMDAAWVAAVFKQVVQQLALPELDPSNVSSHSARIGATHDLVEDDASDAAIMRDPGWKTTRMVGMYSRDRKSVV